MNKKQSFSLIILCFAILCLGILGVTGAWFFFQDSDDLTITLANGIQIEATGLQSVSGTLQNSGNYQLILTNNSGIAPGATVGVENVKLNIKENSDSSNVFLRFKITYEYSTDGVSWSEGSYTDCKLENAIALNAATSSSAGFVEKNGWNYYFSNSNSQTYSNLAILSTSQISLFQNNQQIEVSSSVGEGAQIRITVKIDAVQATQNAVQAEWSGALS